jgi:hypothetical protein
VTSNSKAPEPIETPYGGVVFRSKLEARWAMFLDSFAIVWEYEPRFVELPSGVNYLPDFRLPEIDTWLEVKGDHNERVFKFDEFSKAVQEHSARAGYGDEVVAILGRPPFGPFTAWEPEDQILSACEYCNAWQWWSKFGTYTCRNCKTAKSWSYRGYAAASRSNLDVDGVELIAFDR